MFIVGDLLVYIPLIIVLFIMIPTMDIKVFNNSVALGATFLILIMYIPSSLFFSYTISFIFNKWESAQNAVPTVINMVSNFLFFTYQCFHSPGKFQKNHWTSWIFSINCKRSKTFKMYHYNCFLSYKSWKLIKQEVLQISKMFRYVLEIVILVMLQWFL